MLVPFGGHDGPGGSPSPPGDEKPQQPAGSGTRRRRRRRHHGGPPDVQKDPSKGSAGELEVTLHLQFGSMRPMMSGPFRSSRRRSESGRSRWHLMQTKPIKP